MQLWCKTWPPKGSRHIRAKQKLHKKPREACKSSWSQIGSLKLFTLTIPWKSAKPVKFFPGIIVRQHLTVQRQMVLHRERYAESRKELLQYSCNPAWIEKWWVDSMECYCYLRNIQGLLSGKHFTNGDSANRFKDR